MRGSHIRHLVVTGSGSVLSLTVEVAGAATREAEDLAV